MSTALSKEEVVGVPALKPDQIQAPTTPGALHRDFVNKVVPKAQQAGNPDFTVADAIPITSDTPMPAHPSLEGAEIINAEEPNILENNLPINRRDIGHVIKGWFAGGGHKIRKASGNLFSKLGKGRVNEAAKVKDKRDFSQLPNE